jgi:hypothetical protein
VVTGGSGGWWPIARRFRDGRTETWWGAPLPIGRRGLGEQVAFDWKSASQLFDNVNCWHQAASRTPRREPHWRSRRVSQHGPTRFTLSCALVRTGGPVAGCQQGQQHPGDQVAEGHPWRGGGPEQAGDGAGGQVAEALHRRQQPNADPRSSTGAKDATAACSAVSTQPIATPAAIKQGARAKTLAGPAAKPA